MLETAFNPGSKSIPNIRSAKFWQGGFDVLSKMVDELEKL